MSQPVNIVSDDTEGKMGKHPISEANESSPFGSLSESEFYERHSLSHGSEFITNPRGLKLFTQWWVPLNSEPIGIVCVVHGYTGETSWFVQLTAVFLAKSGFATCAIDHQGHGFSEGLRNHIPDVEPVIDDCVAFFDSFRGRYAPDLPSFLYSESLGGAIALLITLRRSGPNAPVRPFNGVILNGAMCGVSQKYKPPWPLEHFLSLAATLVPTWEIVPVKGSIPDVSFKVEWKRKMAFSSPRRRASRPRAATARELLRICAELQSRFAEVDVPFLIVHGGDDIICDPACTEELFKHASSKDKTIRIFPGMWHQLIGEPDEDVDMIFGEVVEWLRTRAERATAGN